MKITRDMPHGGKRRWRAMYDALEAMGASDGTRETALHLWRREFPNADMDILEYALAVFQNIGEIEGVTIVDGHVLEPVRPVLTGVGRANRARRTDLSPVGPFCADGDPRPAAS